MPFNIGDNIYTAPGISGNNAGGEVLRPSMIVIVEGVVAPIEVKGQTIIVDPNGNVLDVIK